MKRYEMREKQERIEAIRKQMDGIPVMPDGTLMTKRNRVKRKDGTVHVSPDYYTLQYKGADGKRKWKRIPKGAKARVEQLVRAAKRYRKLEPEYTALMTELSLVSGGKKKTIEQAVATASPRKHRSAFMCPRVRRG